MSEVTGSCLCGDMKFKIIGDHIDSSICYCYGCKKISGAPSTAWLVYEPKNFEIIAGELKKYQGPKQEFETCENWGKRAFCPNCGSQIAFYGDDGNIGVAIGSLDSAEDLIPTQELYVEQKWSWTNNTISKK